MRTRSVTPVGLSFLDAMTCGLGAVILLFMIINAAVRDVAHGPMRRILEFSEAPLVSSDTIGNPHSSIFDSASTMASGDGYAKVVSWYDNEWGYSNRVVDLIERLKLD